MIEPDRAKETWLSLMKSCRPLKQVARTLWRYRKKIIYGILWSDIKGVSYGGNGRAHEIGKIDREETPGANRELPDSSWVLGGSGSSGQDSPPALGVTLQLRYLSDCRACAKIRSFLGVMRVSRSVEYIYRWPSACLSIWHRRHASLSHTIFQAMTEIYALEVAEAAYNLVG